MIHIKDLMSAALVRASKAKFYQANRNDFIQYFDSPQRYEALIAAGSFEKMERIIKENSTFDFDQFATKIKEESELLKTTNTSNK